MIKLITIKNNSNWYLKVILFWLYHYQWINNFYRIYWIYKKKFNVYITSITSNGINLYLKDLSSNDILEKTIEDFYNERFSIKFPENKKYLMLEIDGDINEFSAKMPLFKYNFEWKIFILDMYIKSK